MDIVYIQKEQKKIAGLVTKKFRPYYLSGGTALAIYFGHRFSEDLDFFSQKYNQKDPNKIMRFVSEKTSFPYKKEAEQNDPHMVPMQVYSLELKKGIVLKVDFVQDFMKNTKKIQHGLHSINDIYLRKVALAVGGQEKSTTTGRIMPTGRQTARDLYDIFYLSQHYKPVSDFFLEYFPTGKAENLIAWYRSFPRMTFKLEIIDLAPGVDTAKALRHLDDQILKELPRKLIP